MLTVYYALDTAATTATSGSDFAGLPGSVTFASGQATADIPVVVYNDTLVEGSETVAINLQPGGYTLGSPSSGSLTIADNDVNEPPEFDSPNNPDSYTFNVAENSANGTGVGTPGATDPNNNPLIYSITAGNGGGAFAINAGTGQITVANGALLNHEVTPQYTLTVQVSDGTLADTATVTINVTNVNEAPVVNAIANQNNIEGRNVNLQVRANDPDGDAITYAAQGLPGGLTINQNTGLISGKLSYTSAGNHNVTVTVTDAGGLATTVNFVWNVADASIGTLKGTEINAGAAISNSVTVAGITTDMTDTLFISPGNTVRLQVFAPPAGNPPLWTDILFSIDGNGAAPAAGNFAGASWPNISFTGAAPSYSVCAGTDLNGNATLEGTEITHLFVVRVINFQFSWVSSQRVGGGPVEPRLTPIKATEHFEVLGNFKFEVTGGAVGGPNSMIRYELWDTDGIDELLASGWGHTFTYTFGTGVAEGGCFVRFYVDKNNSGTHNNGEIYIDSPGFWVMQKRVFNIVADVSSDIPGAEAFRNNRIGQIFSGANDLLLRKDSASDWRAAVQLNVAATMFVATGNAGARPDPVFTSEAATKHFDAAADVVFVNDYVLTPAMGVTRNYDWHQIIIDYQAHVDRNGQLNDALMSGTLAHELGHGVGLDHPNPDDATNSHRVMTSDSSGTYNHLTQAEARAFDSGPLALAAPAKEGAAAPALTKEELATAFARAAARWTGLTASARFDWSGIELAIADLPDSLLGLTAGNVIWIDQDAAGHGWFIDLTPDENSEFQVRLGEHELQAGADSPAFGRADLLTVLLHEMRHILGSEHGDDEVMEANLPLSIRRLPQGGATAPERGSPSETGACARS